MHLIIYVPTPVKRIIIIIIILTLGKNNPEGV